MPASVDVDNEQRVQEFLRLAVDEGLVDYQMAEDGQWEFVTKGTDDHGQSGWWAQVLPVAVIALLTGILLGGLLMRLLLF